MNAHSELNMPILFSKRQAADALGISLRTIDNLIATRQLKVARIGKRVLIPRKAVEQFARGERTQSVVNQGPPPRTRTAGNEDA
jgi:excisionase family DNA binding protein